MRALYRFGKTRRLSFISHLDLQRFMQMALRRTELPVAYTQGFNPHPILSFASALAMGWTSDCEIMDIRMTRDLEEDFALNEMRRALPPDLMARAVRLVPDSTPALMGRLAASDWQIRLPEGAGERIVSEIPRFLSEESVFALRKTKTKEVMTDIRPLCRALSGKTLPGGGASIECRLDLSEKSTLKPDLLIRTLSERAGIEAPEGARYHRLRLLEKGPDGRWLDLFTERVV